MSLTRAEARQRTPKRETITLDDGATVIVQGMSGKARDVFEATMVGADGKQKPARRAMLAAMGWVDDQGVPLYDAANEADLAELDALDGALLEQIAAAMLRLSGIGQAAQDDLKGN